MYYLALSPLFLCLPLPKKNNIFLNAVIMIRKSKNCEGPRTSNGKKIP